MGFESERQAVLEQWTSLAFDVARIVRAGMDAVGAYSDGREETASDLNRHAIADADALLALVRLLRQESRWRRIAANLERALRAYLTALASQRDDIVSRAPVPDCDVSTAQTATTAAVDENLAGSLSAARSLYQSLGGNPVEIVDYGAAIGFLIAEGGPKS